MSDDAKQGKAAGGYARAEVLSPDERREIARKAAQERWRTDLPLATHAGVLTIGDAEISCYVLEDHTRIISTRGIMKALRRTWRGRKYPGTELPVFIEAQNLKPFIDKDLSTVLAPIQFRTDRGSRGEGFKAEILPAVCDIYLRAREAGALTAPQVPIAQQCEILVRALSKVGIIALVDEATGYQEVRDRLALQKILDRFLTAEKAKWAKTFPDDFYRKLFRLKGWAYNPASIARPGVIGKYTNDIVYDRLAPGVLKKLQELNPKTESGNRRAKHHQFFTTDYGVPELKQHIFNVMFLMDAAGDDWDLFRRLIDRASPRKGTTLPLLPEAALEA